jgi:hypothetical protein
VLDIAFVTVDPGTLEATSLSPLFLDISEKLAANSDKLANPFSPIGYEGSVSRRIPSRRPGKSLWAETATGPVAQQFDILLIFEYPIGCAVPVNGQSRGCSVWSICVPGWLSFPGRAFSNRKMSMK